MSEKKPFFAAALAVGLCGCAHVPPDYYSPPSGRTVWNFNDPADPLGVDAMETDYPAELISLLPPKNN